MSKRYAFRNDRLLTPLAPCPTPHKIGYNTRDGAMAALRSTRERGTPARRESGVHSCACGKWHLTSMRIPQVEVPLSAPLPAGLRPEWVA